MRGGEGEAGDRGGVAVSKRLTVLGAIAQFERDMMLERQREGIAKAKSDGRYKGRKPIDDQRRKSIFKPENSVSLSFVEPQVVDSVVGAVSLCFAYFRTTATNLLQRLLPSSAAP